jgi:RNase P subunit RPR2
VALHEHMASLPATESVLRTFRPTRCPRCQGFMVLERYEDWGSTTTAQAFLAWDCVQCGEVIDPVILENRRSCQSEGQGNGRLPIPHIISL